MDKFYLPNELVAVSYGGLFYAGIIINVQQTSVGEYLGESEYSIQIGISSDDTPEIILTNERNVYGPLALICNSDKLDDNVRNLWLINKLVSKQFRMMYQKEWRKNGWLSMGIDARNHNGHAFIGRSIDCIVHDGIYSPTTCIMDIADYSKNQHNKTLYRFSGEYWFPIITEDQRLANILNSGHHTIENLESYSIYD